MKSDLLFGFIAVGATIFAMVSGLHTRATLRVALTRIGELLGGGSDADNDTAWGSALGLPTTLRFVRRAGGAPRELWTQIDVKLPARYPLVLAIRRHDSRDRMRIAAGELVDVRLGDPSFDRAFLVEAAPAEVARRLLGRRARDFLYRLGDVELTTAFADGPVLRLVVRGKLEDPAAAAATISALIAIAGDVREAYAAVEQQDSGSRLTGAPYRAEPTAEPSAAAAAAREAEVARLLLLQRKRRLPDHFGPVLAVVVFAVFLALMVAR